MGTPEAVRRQYATRRRGPGGAARVPRLPPGAYRGARDFLSARDSSEQGHGKPAGVVENDGGGERA
jgi:hypothetical protein